MRLLFFDGGDSFTYNVVDALFRLGVRHVEVVDTDSFQTADEVVSFISRGNFSHCVIGPGPGGPGERRHIIEAVCPLEGRVVLFGICLGHQVIIEAYGGKVFPTGQPVHGKVSEIFHSSRGLFHAIDSPLLVGRYHSLAACSVPPPLFATAYSRDQDGVSSWVMAVEHRSAPTVGVQFHPESFLSECGLDVLRNFLRMSCRLVAS